MIFEVTGVLFAIAALAFISLCVDFYRHRWPVKNFPPGPGGWPVLGNPVLMRPDMHLELGNISQKYGKVFSFALGRYVVVVVNGQEAINEGLVKNLNATASRGKNYVQTLYNPNLRGVIDGTFSENWLRQRHFTVTTLRSFGFGTKNFKEKVMVEVQEALDGIEKRSASPFNPLHLLSATTSSVVSSITLGVRFSQSDMRGKFERLSEVSSNWFDITYRSNALNAFPFIRPFAWRMKRKVRWAFDGLADFVREEIRDHEASFDAESEPRDFIDCYLAEMRRHPELYTREDLTMILIDLFLGGAETTAVLLTFALLNLIIHPDIQEKVQEELMEVVGPNRLPSMKDQPNLPYTNAVIMETARHSTLVPIVFRAAATDFVLGGYNIPKGTNLMINLWSVQHDPAVWPDPDKFDPSRFLDKPDIASQRDNILLFGAGRKICLGRNLAKMELFLFFSCMVHRFKFSVPSGCEKPSAKPITRLLNYPPPFELMASPRW